MGLQNSIDTIMWMLRALWLVVAHDLSEYRYMDDVTRNLFPFFVQHGARFWKCTCIWDYFGLKQVKSSKKVQQELFTRKKNGETGTKRALEDLRMPKLQEVSTTATDRVSSLWGSSLKFVFPLLMSSKNALPHSTIACNVSYFQGLQGCALGKISGSPSGSQAFKLGCPGLQVGRPN